MNRYLEKIAEIVSLETEIDGQRSKPISTLGIGTIAGTTAHTVGLAGKGKEIYHRAADDVYLNRSRVNLMEGKYHRRLDYAKKRLQLYREEHSRDKKMGIGEFGKDDSYTRQNRVDLAGKIRRQRNEVQKHLRNIEVVSRRTAKHTGVGAEVRTLAKHIGKASKSILPYSIAAAGTGMAGTALYNKLSGRYSNAE